MCRLMGVSFKGKSILQSQNMFDHSNLEFADKTILDSSCVFGHYAIFDKITVGPCRMQGTIHPYSTVSCFDVKTRESGPAVAYVMNLNEQIMNDRSVILEWVKLILSSSFLIGCLSVVIVWVLTKK